MSKHNQKKSKKGKDGKKGGGMMKFLFVATLLVGAAGAGFWFLAPEEFQTQLDALRQMVPWI